MNETNRIDINQPGANAYGVVRCPQCNDSNRWLNLSGGKQEIICDECGFTEKAALPHEEVA